jgi:hypothetical protein
VGEFGRGLTISPLYITGSRVDITTFIVNVE